MGQLLAGPALFLYVPFCALWERMLRSNFWSVFHFLNLLTETRFPGADCVVCVDCVVPFPSLPPPLAELVGDEFRGEYLEVKGKGRFLCLSTHYSFSSIRVDKSPHKRWVINNFVLKNATDLESVAPLEGCGALQGLHCRETSKSVHGEWILEQRHNQIMHGVIPMYYS